MTLHLEIPQDVERRISQAAAQEDLSFDAYVLSLLDRETEQQSTFPPAPEDFAAY